MLRACYSDDWILNNDSSYDHIPVDLWLRVRAAIYLSIYKPPFNVGKHVIKMFIFNIHRLGYKLEELKNQRIYLVTYLFKDFKIGNLLIVLVISIDREDHT